MSPQVSKAFLSVLADLNNAVVWTFSTCPLITKSSSRFTNSLHWLQLVSPSRSYFFFFFFFFFLVLYQDRDINLSFRFLFILLRRLPGRQSPLFGRFFLSFFLSFLFLWLSWCLSVDPRLDDLFVSQNPRKLCESRSSGRILGCVYTTCSSGQISVSCTIPSWSPSPQSYVKSYILLALICYIGLLCDWSFSLYYHVNLHCNHY